MELDRKEEEKLTVLKDNYGIKATSELVRLLITFEYEKIMQKRTPTSSSSQHTS
jgi:hypothetical protein